MKTPRRNRTNSPTYKPRPRGTVTDRFWAKVKRRGPNQCWPWTASLNGKGYGQMNVRGRPVLAHRISFELERGYEPTGRLVCHKCDNPICVNPNHLFVGTPMDNTKDMIRKGRQAVGERRKNAKLTTQDVLAIRASTEPISTLSERYKISSGHVSAVRNHKAWKHVADAAGIIDRADRDAVMADDMERCTVIAVRLKNAQDWAAKELTHDPR